MKDIYFACSIRGGRDYVQTYAELVGHIKTMANVLTEIFADNKLTPSGINKPSAEIWKIDTDWLRQSDAMIAEVTMPSLGVGYEIALAESLGKPILALFREAQDKKLSAIIGGAPGVTVVNYHDNEEAKDAVTRFVKELN